MLYSFSAIGTGALLLHVLTNYFNVPCPTAMVCGNSTAQTPPPHPPPPPPPLYSMIWGKRQIPVLSPWLPSVNLQNFKFPHPFPLNLKKSREFSPTRLGQRIQSIPLYIPQYIPLVGLGSYPWGKPMTCALQGVYTGDITLKTPGYAGF